MDRKEEKEEKEDMDKDRAKNIVRGLANYRGGGMTTLHAELMSFFPPSMEDNVPFALYSRYYTESKEPDSEPEDDFVPLDLTLPPLEKTLHGRYKNIILNKNTGKVLNQFKFTFNNDVLYGTDDIPIEIDINTNIDKTNHFRIQIPWVCYNEDFECKRSDKEYLVYNGGKFDGELVKLDRFGRAIYMPELTNLYLIDSVIKNKGTDGKKGKKSRRNRKSKRNKTSTKNSNRK